jgi:hypothetical protein
MTEVTHPGLSQYLKDWCYHIGPPSDNICVNVVGLRVFAHHSNSELRENLNYPPSATPICDLIEWVR